MKTDNIINIGNTYQKVQVFHAKHSLLYFVKNFMETDISIPEELFGKLCEFGQKKLNNKNILN